METRLVDENEIAASFIQKTTEKAGHTHVLRGLKIDVTLHERLVVHPPVQGSHATLPGRFHKHRKVAMIDVDVDGLVAHFLCVIKEGRVLECSEGVVGKCVVAGNEIGIAQVGKGAGGNTNAKIFEAPLGLEGLEERCGGARVAVQAEIAATN